jgi:hypothetical protein
MPKYLRLRGSWSQPLGLRITSPDTASETIARQRRTGNPVSRRGNMSQMYNPWHPSAVLKEALSDFSVTDAAKRPGVGRMALSR